MINIFQRGKALITPTDKWGPAVPIVKKEEDMDMDMDIEGEINEGFEK